MEHRVYRTRARRRGGDVSSLRRNGPAPSSETARGEQQRRRRIREAGRRNAAAVMEHLIRLGVLAVTRFSESSDVARLTVLCGELQARGFSRESAAAVLILDFAARAPGFTKDFISALDDPEMRRKRRRVRGAELLQLYRDMWRCSTYRCYWVGPIRLNMVGFLKTAKAENLAVIAQRLVSGERVRIWQLMREITAEKFVNTYAGFCMLRCVSAALDVRLRHCAAEAANMSLHTSLLAELMPFGYARKALKAASGYDIPDGMMAFLMCETVKLLRNEAVLEPLSHYENNPFAFAEAMADMRASRLVVRMAGLEPVTDSDPSETEEVNSSLPDAASGSHTAQHTMSRWRRCLRAAARRA